MDYLPEPVTRWLEGRIDPTSQNLVETHAQTFLVVLTAIGFVASWFTQSVLVGLEVFTAGFVVLLLLAVPPWPFLNRHPIKFLPVRKPPPS
ncbi:hypothetical protein JCM24511_03334 [Saitozyma sp. JCM 24511]|nr:hypothetical protein JCM24511_03334 [Saitozyma sp. JCM 24511]